MLRRMILSGAQNAFCLQAINDAARAIETDPECPLQIACRAPFDTQDIIFRGLVEPIKLWLSFIVIGSHSTQPIDRGPSRPLEGAGAGLVHPSQGDNGPMTPLSQQAKSRWTQPPSPRMRPGGEHRRKQHRICFQPVSEADLTQIVSGCQVQKAFASWPQRKRCAVNPIRSPFGRGQCAVGKDNRVPITPGHRLKCLKPFPTFRIAEVVVSID